MSAELTNEEKLEAAALLRAYGADLYDLWQARKRAGYRYPDTEFRVLDHQMDRCRALADKLDPKGETWLEGATE